MHSLERKRESMNRYENGIALFLLALSTILKMSSVFILYTAYAHIDKPVKHFCSHQRAVKKAPKKR